MATSYVLPASPMVHSHHGHGHSHSHSHSPSRSHSTNAPRPLKQERPNGTLHSYSYSEALNEYSQHTGRREPEVAPQFQRHSAYSVGPSGLSEEHRPLDSYDLPRIDTDLPPHGHGHDHHQHSHGHDHHDHHDHHHGHSHTNIVVPVQPRSKFTNLILPFVLRWPLVHTIMADKDSRRIFYFMTYEKSLTEK